MSTDKTPEDQITEAGAVELEETQLDNASGGLTALAPTALKISSTGLKISSPELKIRPVDVDLLG